MFKFLQRLLVVFLSLIALSVFGLWMAASYVDVNILKPYIEEAIAENTQVSLVIHDPLVVNYWPKISVVAGNLEIFHGEKTQRELLASIKRANVAVELLPLLGRKVRIKSIHIEGADIGISRSVEGMWNFQSALVSEADSSNNTYTNFKISLENIYLSDSSISYFDHVSQTYYEVEHLNFSGIDIFGKTFAPLSLQAEVKSPQYWTATIEVATRALVDPSGKSSYFKDSSIKGRIKEGLVTPVDFRIKSDKTWSLGDESIYLDGFSLQSPSVQLVGSGELTISAPFSFDGEIRTDNLRLNEFVRLWMPKWKSWFEQGSTTIRELNAEVFVSGEQLDIRKANAILVGGSRLELHSLLKFTENFSTVDSADFSISSEMFDTSILSKNLPALTLKNVAANGKYQNQVLSLSSVRGRVWDGLLKAQGSFDFDPSQFSGELEISGVNLATFKQSIARESDWGLRGQALLQMSLHAEGNTQAHLLSTLQGSGKLAGRGHILLDPSTTFFLDMAKVLGMASAKNASAASLSFSKASGSFTVRDGIVRNDDFSTNMEFLDIAGSGSANLTVGQLNYVLLVEARNNDIQFPITFSGPFDNIQTDFALSQFIQQGAKKAASSLFKTLEKRIPAGLGNIGQKEEVTGSADSSSPTASQEQIRKIRDVGDQVGRAVKDSVDQAKNKLKDFFKLPF